MDYEKIFLDWKTRRTFENEMPESSADSKNDTTKCAGMSDTSERNGSKLSTLCELTIEAGELEKALLDKVYGQQLEEAGQDIIKDIADFVYADKIKPENGPVYKKQKLGAPVGVYTGEMIDGLEAVYVRKP